MGFFSSFAGSMGSGLGTGLTTGVNNWVRYLDKNALGGALGIDAANSEYLYQDTLMQGMAQADASAYGTKKNIQALKEGLIENNFNPLLALENGIGNLTLHANGGTPIPQSQGGQGDFVSDEQRENDTKISHINKQIAETNLKILEAGLGKAVSEATIAESSALKASIERSIMENPEYQDALKSSTINGLQRSAYQNSRGHAIFEDVRSTLGDVVNGIIGWRGSSAKAASAKAAGTIADAAKTRADAIKSISRPVSAKKPAVSGAQRADIEKFRASHLRKSKKPVPPELRSTKHSPKPLKVGK